MRATSTRCSSAMAPTASPMATRASPATGARSAGSIAPTSPRCSAALEKIGYDVGSADGLPGFKTRRSIGDWQAKNGRAADLLSRQGAGVGELELTLSAAPAPRARRDAPRRGSRTSAAAPRGRRSARSPSVRRPGPPDERVDAAAAPSPASRRRRRQRLLQHRLAPPGRASRRNPRPAAAACLAGRCAD